MFYLGHKILFEAPVETGLPLENKQLLTIITLLSKCFFFKLLQCGPHRSSESCFFFQQYFSDSAAVFSSSPSSARNYDPVLKAPGFSAALGCWKGKGVRKVFNNILNKYFQHVWFRCCRFWKICILCWASSHKSFWALPDISNTENVGAKHTSRIYHQFICSLSQIYQFKFHHNVLVKDNQENHFRKLLELICYGTTMY